MVFAAMPGFWLALMMIIVFSVNLGWLPATGVTTWKGYILPVVCNALGSVAVVVRMLRSSMLEVIRQDYIRTARAKGLTEGMIIRKHALKNALMPVITIIGMQVSMIMGGSVIIETIFNIPGLGLYMMNGISGRDYPIICGCVLIISLCVCVMNLVVDLVYAFIDPRIKAQYSKGKKKHRKSEKEQVEGGRQGEG
jgi:peptide/nickel transport system permease protein